MRKKYIKENIDKQSFGENFLEKNIGGKKLVNIFWSGLVWSGLVWSGLVWSGLVWSGLWFRMGWGGYNLVVASVPHNQTNEWTNKYVNIEPINIFLLDWWDWLEIWRLAIVCFMTRSIFTVSFRLKAFDGFVKNIWRQSKAIIDKIKSKILYRPFHLNHYHHHQILSYFGLRLEMAQTMAYSSHFQPF